MCNYTRVSVCLGVLIFARMQMNLHLQTHYVGHVIGHHSVDGFPAVAPFMDNLVVPQLVCLGKAFSAHIASGRISSIYSFCRLKTVSDTYTWGFSPV